jgi:antitoxin (DNA-binding transcriptional repressor) of toxin-antitoxin stability system
MSVPKIITMVQLRQRAREVVRAVRGGQKILLSYRGRTVLRLEPVSAPKADRDDPFYRLAELADGRAASLSNGQIDDIVYGR